MIVGSTGAGKTTYSMKLAEETGAVRFSVDEWMAELFMMDAPNPLSYQWALERTERCEARMLAVCKQLAVEGPDVIMDLGFFKRSQRERVWRALVETGMAVRVHFLDVPAETRWQRVSHRNETKGETFSLEVTRGMFDFCEDLFEAPTQSELAGAVVVNS